MSLDSIPEELRAKAVIKFLDGHGPDDRAPERALTNFVGEVARDMHPDAYDVANIALDDSDFVLNLIEKAKQELAAEQTNLIEGNKTAHEQRVVQYHEELAQGNKVSLLISIGMSLGTLVMGVAASPVVSIIFKHKLAAIDKWYNPEDYAPLTADKSIVAKSARSHSAPDSTVDVEKSTAQSSSGDVVHLQESPYGPQDPITGKSMYDLLRQGKTLLLPDKETSICLKRPIPIPCKPAQPLIP